MKIVSLSLPPHSSLEIQGLLMVHFWCWLCREGEVAGQGKAGLELKGAGEVEHLGKLGGVMKVLATVIENTD